MNNKKDIDFLIEMRENTQSLLNDKFDITKVEHLDRMISDWHDELLSQELDTETPMAKLRNLLSPLYSLAQTVQIGIDNPEMKEIILELSNRALSYKDDIDAMLKRIDKYKDDEVEKVSQKLIEVIKNVSDISKSR